MTPPPFTTLAQMFLQVTDRPNDALMQSKIDGVWTPISATEVRRRVARLSAALLGMGLQHGDRVAILSENSPQWALADYACIAAGLVVVPIYPTLTAEQTQYILKDSGARVAFVSNDTQGAKVGGVTAISMQKLPEVDCSDADFIARCKSIRAEDLLSILYTSGTTGTPKGVMLSHRNLASNIQNSHPLFDEGDLALSFLPLSHIFERMADYLYLYRGASIAYLANIDDVAQALVEVRPTLMCAVPRFFEKLYARVIEQVKLQPPMRQKIFWWAVGVGKEHLECELNEVPVHPILALENFLAGKLVFAKMRARMGGRLRVVVSGSAPLSRELAEFFLACGITLLEGYGLTETSPVLCANAPGAIRLGTVGRAIAGVEIKIAEDGEILARGPNIMEGYYHNPEATAEAIVDGWFHTGDVGLIDADGYLTITDRKKDLLKTAGGKYVAPQPIENKLKMNPYILNAVVIGDRRKFIAAIVVVNMEALGAHARLAGLNCDLRDPKIVEFMQKEVDQCTPDLAQFERIKKLILLDHDFSIAGGTLTPTLKARRAAVELQYKEQIDKLYGATIAQ